MNKKIAIIAQNIVPGGVYRLGIMESKYLNEMYCHDCTYYSIIKPSHPWTLAKEFDIKYKYIFDKKLFKIPILENALSRIFGSHKKINDKNFDLIIAHNNPSANIAYKMKKKFGIPYILYLHDPLTFSIVGDIYWLMFLFLRKVAINIENKFVQNAKYVMVNSIKNKSFIEKTYGINSKKVILLYPSTTIERISKEKLPKSRGSYFLFVGRIDHHPSFPLLFNIMKSLRNLKIVVAGYKSPKTGTDIINMFKSDSNVKDRVSFIISPKDNDLIKLYQNARAFLSPGHENFNMSALEAMNNGCPILIADSSGICEIFDDYPVIKNKIALPSNNIKIWTDSIKYLMINEKEAVSLGYHCWKISERYSLKSHMNHLNSLIVGDFNDDGSDI